MSQVDLSDENVTWDMRERMSYAGYLDLPALLSCQNRVSKEHDEMLFIVIHQVSELWMKLALHEVDAALALVKVDQLDAVFKMLSRVVGIQHQLVEAWGVLATLTPADYVKFRDALGSSSGFQSFQYRHLEFALGNKNADMVKVYAHNPKVHEKLVARLDAPSLYDEALLLLNRRGFDIPANKVERPWREGYQPDPAVEAAWLKVYRDTTKYWDLYELAEKLVDIEHHFRTWRFRHMTTVERIIGFKRGTGGTSGVPYLAKALDLRFFPELWTVRTSI